MMCDGILHLLWYRMKNGHYILESIEAIETRSERTAAGINRRLWNASSLLIALVLSTGFRGEQPGRLPRAHCSLRGPTVLIMIFMLYGFSYRMEPARQQRIVVRAKWNIKTKSRKNALMNGIRYKASCQSASSPTRNVLICTIARRDTPPPPPPPLVLCRLGNVESNTSEL